MMSGQTLIFASCCVANADSGLGFVEVADENGRPPERGKIPLDAKVETTVPGPVKLTTCVHEASHVVAALLLGQHVEYVAVQPIPRTGIVWRGDVSPLARAAVLLIGRHAGNKSERLRIRLMDAAWRWFCASSAAGTNGACDFCLATNIARSEAGEDGSLQWLRDRESEALDILDDPVAWRAIRAIADVLKERGRLSGKEARRLARAAGLEFEAIDIDILEDNNVA